MARTHGGQNNGSHDVGSKVYIPLPIWVRAEAVFGGEHDEYRYRLSRTWDDRLPTVLFLMMNPSVADILVDDMTVLLCRRYAENWGYGRLYVGNTFAYRCTQSARLLEVEDPIGPDNDRHLLEMAKEASLIVMAYGQPHPSLRWRGIAVAGMLRAEGHQLHVLRLSKDGTPRHPLRQGLDLKPTLWEESAEYLKPVPPARAVGMGKAMNRSIRA